MKTLKMLGLTALALGLTEAVARDYSSMVTPVKSEDAMWTKAADWSNGEVPTSQHDYYSNGKDLYSCGWDGPVTNPNTGAASRRDHFFGNVMYLNSAFYLTNQTNPAKGYPTTFENEGLYLLDGAILYPWGANSYLGGKLTLENTADDTFSTFKASPSKAGDARTLTFVGELASDANSGLFVCLPSGKTAGTVVFDFCGTAANFLGTIATQSGGVIRVEKDLAKGAVKLGYKPTGNSGCAFATNFDNALGQNGRLDVKPESGDALSIGTVSSTGGTIAVDAGKTLAVDALTLDGGTIALVGTSAETIPSLTVSTRFSVKGPVKIALGNYLPLTKKALLTVPVSAGALDIKDWTIEGLSGSAAYLAKPRVETVEDIQYLYIGGGFIYKTANDSGSTHAHVNKLWSDGEQQHAGALYYNNGKEFYLNDPRGYYTFEDGETRRALLWRGDGLVIDGDVMIMTYAYSGDAITVEGEGMVLFGSPHFRTWWEHSALDGKIVVKTDDVCIESTYKGACAWDLPCTLIGDATAKVKFQHQAGLATNPNYCGRIYTCNVYGNVDDWQGTFYAATNHILNAQAGFPKGTAELARGATLKCTASAMPAFGGIVSAGKIEMKAGDVWAVGTLALDDGVIRIAGDTDTAGAAKIAVSASATLSAGKINVVLAKHPAKTSAFILEAPSACTLSAADISVTCEDGYAGENIKIVVAETAGGKKTYSVMRKEKGFTVYVY